MKVAVLGCGSGFYSMAAAKAVGGKREVYAVDVERGFAYRFKKEAARKDSTT